MVIDQRCSITSGDVIFVPVATKNVSIEGAIARPAIYEAKAEEDLGTLIDMAGGTNNTAYEKRVTIQGLVSSGQPVILNVDLLSETSESPRLYDGDSILISDSTSQVFNPVELSGAFVRPAVYAWEEGSRLSDYIDSIPRDLTIDADLGTGLIVRQKI